MRRHSGLRTGAYRLPGSRPGLRRVPVGSWENGKGVATIMTGEKQRVHVRIIMAATALCLAAASLGLQGCGKDQAKQDFVNGLISIIEDNQSQPEIAEKGRSAFMAYYRSAFTDLESAAAAAESFTLSNEKDAGSLARLQALEKPDGQAEEIAAGLREGIETMDRGNAFFASELARAPEQSVEERSMIFQSTEEAMALYLDGISAIISACEMLRDYAKEHGLDGVADIEKWIEKFGAEKESIERSM